jgi:hypothetical protein
MSIINLKLPPVLEKLRKLFKIGMKNEIQFPYQLYLKLPPNRF